MNRKKIFLGSVMIFIFSIIGLFFWPRSFASAAPEARSISVVVIEESLDHSNTTYVYNDQDPQFGAIMDVLDRYSYHMSLQTISSYFENGTSMEGNQAGYWLHIYLYTEPDRFGECYAILSGGTGEIIVDDAVYRIGYWGNGTAIKMMDEICQIVAP